MYSLCTLHEFWGWLSWTIGCGRAFICHMSSTLPSPTPPPAKPTVKMCRSCVTFPLLDSVWIPPLLVLSWILETLPWHISASLVFRIFFHFVLTIIISYISYCGIPLSNKKEQIWFMQNLDEFLENWAE